MRCCQQISYFYTTKLFRIRYGKKCLKMHIWLWNQSLCNSWKSLFLCGMHLPYLRDAWYNLCNGELHLGLISRQHLTVIASIFQWQPVHLTFCILFYPSWEHSCYAICSYHGSSNTRTQKKMSCALVVWSCLSQGSIWLCCVFIKTPVQWIS